jgi:chloramphenicol 3-O-phosphotransferase
MGNGGAASEQNTAYGDEVPESPCQHHRYTAGMSLTPDKANDLRAPTLVIVSGAPASGKSTLARHLSTVLSLPLLARDAFTEILADAFDVRSTAQRATIVQPTHTIYYAVLDQLLAAGVSVIAESNFQRGLS